MYLTGLSGVIKYSFKKAIGRAPKTLPYKNGAFVAFLNASIDRASLPLARQFTAKATQTVLARAGLGMEAELAKCATLVEEGKEGREGSIGWKGLWIPYQGGLPIKDPHQKDDSLGAKVDHGDENAFNPSEGSDLVILHAHGGGFIDGNASSKVPFWLQVMSKTYVTHGTKISVLSLEYSLAPEHPYPTSFYECLAAYKSLVVNHHVDPKRVVFCGESAGGSLMQTLVLKIRDEPQLGLSLPAGTVLTSPWLFTDPKRLEALSFDILTPPSVEFMMDCYSSGSGFSVAELIENPSVCPLKASTLAGLPPMLVYIGGAEIFRPSIEEFVKRVQAEGVECQVELKEDRCHCWFQNNLASTEEDRQQAIAALASFLNKVQASR
ncbi:hypothetical protein EMPS_06384 [Entomortierella parvispora]|uniref:Alpha/beta hydrolase fold-3 domain-containing protein n=1 Tax=Entomortierella parvispora TaxID=205924 RepID=A0A9P3HCH3_9FUNG|nr:hypothetical protein EMPS_06384 [Entomortierella parvispora]